MLYKFFLFLHIIVSALMVVVILLQSSKGGGLAGSAFGGGGGSMSFLGARGTATFLSRATAVLAIIFMLNSLSLSLLLRGIGQPVSVTQREIQSEAQRLPRVGGQSDYSTGEIPVSSLPATGDQVGEAALEEPAVGGKTRESEKAQQ